MSQYTHFLQVGEAIVMLRVCMPQHRLRNLSGDINQLEGAQSREIRSVYGSQMNPISR